MEEEKKPEVTEEQKEEPVTEETQVEIKKEDISITAPGEDTPGEAKESSQAKPVTAEEEKETSNTPTNNDVLKAALADHQKQLEEMRSILDGQEKAHAEALAKMKAEYEEKLKAAEERSQKLENDISELRTSPTFYRSTTTTSEREMKFSDELSQDDRRKLQNIV